MSESSFGGDFGGGDFGSADLGGGGDLGGGMSSPSFGPDPSVPSFASDPLGTPGLGTTTSDPFAYTPPAPITPSAPIGSSTDPGFLGMAGPQIGAPIPTIGGIGPGAGLGVASPSTLENYQAALPQPGAPFDQPSVFGPPPGPPMVFTPPLAEPDPVVATPVDAAPADAAPADPAPADPAPADPAPADPAPADPTSTPALPTFVTATAADGFSIAPAAATAVVDTATGLTADTGGFGTGLASLALSPAVFGGFGAPVAAGQTALQTTWGQAFTSLTQGFTTLFGHVGDAISGYIGADTSVAQGFGDTAKPAGPTPPSPTTPPQDLPLPPGGWDSMRPSDLYTPFLLDGAAADFALHGWWNAAGLVDHYLGGTGTDYAVDPAQMMRDIPTFQGLVDGAVAAHAGEATWQTDWANTNTDLRDAAGTYTGQQSNDWFWGLHDFRYRVFGTTDPTTGQGAYTVEVYKPYVFGSPRSDITVPGTGGMWKVPQDDLQHLHDTGRAADFIVRGSATFPR